MGKYIDQLNERYEPDKLVKSVNTVNTGESDFKTHGSIFDTDTLDTLHSVSTLTVANTPHRRGKNKFATLDTLKAADAFKYVACVNCTNLEKGYCTARGHRPEVPEYEIRLCNKFKQEQRIHNGYSRHC